MMMILETSFLCPGINGIAHLTDNAVQCECGNRNLQSLARILDRKPCASQIVPFVDLVCAYVDNYQGEPGLDMIPESWD